MEIDKELYKQIKEYCELNGIKPKEYIHNLLSKAFMEDKYGKSPFNFNTESNGDKSFDNIPETVVKTKVQEIVKSMKSGDEEFSEIIEQVGGSDKYNDMVSDLIFEDNVAKNENTEQQNKVRDTVSQEMSRNKDVNGQRKVKKRKIESR